MRMPLLLASAMLFTVACEKKTATTDPRPADTKQPVVEVKPAPKDDVILLGEVGSLTGAEAAFGISTRDGIAMAIDEANEAGGVKGKKLAVRVYDDKTSKLKMTCTGDATVPGHSNRISCIRFQNGSQLATGSMDGAV